MGKMRVTQKRERERQREGDIKEFWDNGYFVSELIISIN